MRSESRECDVGLLLSGGLDSSILLGHLLRQGHTVRPFYIRSRLVWEREELAAARQYLDAFSSPRLGDMVVLELPLADLYQGHWSLTGDNPPDAESPDRAVYLPGRNALLIVKAALWCRLHGIDALALGVLQSNPFSDASAEFFDGYEAALNCAVDGQLRILRPFGGMNKRQVMELGRDFPLELTFSCLAPSQGRHCGACNKCAERNAAFGLINAEDPTSYLSPMTARW